MPCLTPYRGDTSQMLLFKIASCLEASGTSGSGVTSFNGLTGAVTGVVSFNGRDGAVILSLADVAAVGDSRYVLKAGDTMTGALVHPDGTAALPSITFTGDLDTGIYHPAVDTVGLAAGGSIIFSATPTGVEVADGLTYRLGGVEVAKAQHALANYYFMQSGNTTGTGTFNLGVGTHALEVVTTGGNNIALGSRALFSLTTGSLNIGTGFQTMFNLTTGTGNTAEGCQSLFSLTTGSKNTGIGNLAASGITTGSNNTIIGANLFPGSGITTGSNNTLLGAFISGLAAGLSNNIIIADGSGNQRITVGSTGIVTIPIALTLSTAAPLSVASGTNQRAGDVTLVGGTVTTANTTVTANTRVFVSRKTIGGTPGTEFVYTLVAGVSFTITSNLGTDTSVISYLLIEVP